MDELLRLQYQTLRTEILDIMKSNDASLEKVIIFCSTLWAAVPTLLAATKVDYIPSSLLLLPSFIILTSLSKYVTNKKRVANIGSFLAFCYKSHIADAQNWEKQISLYSRNPPVDLNSVFSNEFLYDSLVKFSVGSGLLMLFYNSIIKDNFNLIDFSLTIFLAFIAVVIFSKIKKKRGEYTNLRASLDNHWEKVFQE